jgi:NAD(P)-dependent dehydrogenase (short-subunit alcohol dehydrogenase family)
MPSDLQRLTNKVCMIIGAASALAQVVADCLTRESATVVGIDRREHSVGVHSRRADLTDEDRVRQLGVGGPRLDHRRGVDDDFSAGAAWANRRETAKV